MNISSKVNNLDGLKRSLSVTVDKNEYINAFNKGLGKYKTTAKIDGFRAGKVPENIIIKNYKDRIHGDAMNLLIENSLTESLLENKLDTASPPKLSITQIGSFENDLIFTAEFEIYPLFSVKKIEDIEIEQPDVEINDNDIGEVVKNIQKQHIKWEEKKSKSKAGDKIVLDYEGLIAGDIFENNKQDSFTFIIGDKVNGDSATTGLFKAFYDNTTDEEVDSEKSFQYKMPSDFSDKKIAGKTIDYKIKIKHIYEGVLPELDDDFYKKFGVENSDYEIFKDNVSKYMKVELDQKMKSIKSAAINQVLLDQNDFELPKHMLDTEIKNISSQYEGMKQKIDDKIKLELDLIARKRVKLNLIYMKLTEVYKLIISEKDVYEFISKSDPATQEQLIQKAKEDKNYLNHIKNKLLEDAIIDLIASKCRINKIKKKFLEVVN
jgi:trigger factor|tara:strand:- start:270 stop:1574 length:1305 start_codon:yes stop_codon:yes gene_type:complete